MSEILYDLEGLAIVIATAIFSFFELKCFFDVKPSPWRWIKLVYGIIGIYWAGLYLFVFLANPANYSAVMFGRIFVRPALLLTFSFFAVAAILRSKQCK